MISIFQGKGIMNSRGDWGQNLPPELVVEHNGRKRKSQGREQKLKPAQNKENPEQHPQNEQPKNKRRKIELDPDRAPPIKSKSLTIKEMLSRLQISGKAREGGQERGGNTSGEEVEESQERLDTTLDGNTPGEGGSGTQKACLGMKTGGSLKSEICVDMIEELGGAMGELSCCAKEMIARNRCFKRSNENESVGSSGRLSGEMIKGERPEVIGASVRFELQGTPEPTTFEKGGRTANPDP